MIRRPPRSTPLYSSAASDVYKRQEEMLSPSYAGIRPITSKEDRVKRDFMISTVENHKIENLFNLYGIESPGLTSSLAIANYVTERL